MNETTNEGRSSSLGALDVLIEVYRKIADQHPGLRRPSGISRLRRLHKYAPEGARGIRSVLPKAIFFQRSIEQAKIALKFVDEILQRLHLGIEQQTLNETLIPLELINCGG